MPLHTYAVKRYGTGVVASAVNVDNDRNHHIVKDLQCRSSSPTDVQSSVMISYMPKRVWHALLHRKMSFIINIQQQLEKLKTWYASMPWNAVGQSSTTNVILISGGIMPNFEEEADR